MDEDLFRNFLNKSGRKSNVIKKYVNFVKTFEKFIDTHIQISQGENLKDAYLVEFIEDYENKTKQSARTLLYALMQYFKAIKNEPMFNAAKKLRESRKAKRPPFPLKNILEVNPLYIEQLNKSGIKNVNDLLTVGKTPSQRNDLAKKTEIPSEVILELVKIADLTRVGYVKEKLTRLYYNAGIQTPEELSKWKAEDLQKHFKEYINSSGWDGMVPYLSDLKSNISRAKQLESCVKYKE